MKTCVRELQTNAVLPVRLALLSFPAAVAAYSSEPIRRKRRPRRQRLRARQYVARLGAGRTRYRGEMRPVQL